MFDLIKDDRASAGGEETPPLPVTVFLGRKIGQGRMVVLNEKSHRAGLVREVDRTPESREEGCFLFLTDRTLIGQEKYGATFCEIGLSLGKGRGDDNFCGIRS